MGKLFIDTQVLYELLGFDSNLKVKSTRALSEYIMNRKDVFITSTVISEILVKQRNCEEKVMQILEFVSNPHFHIVNTPVLGFDCTSFISRFSTTTKNELDVDKINEQIGKEVLRSKADYEAEFIEFFVAMAKLYLGLLTCFYIPIQLVEGMRLFQTAIYMQNNLDNIKTELFDSYNADPQKYVQTVFNDSMNTFLSLITGALEDRIKEKTHNSNMRKYVKKVKEYQNEQQPLKILKFVETKDFIEAEFSTDDVVEQKNEILNEIRSKIEEILLNKVGNAYFSEYAMMLFDKWRTSGNKFMKNDISDMIILMSLWEPDSEIITFDDKSYDFLAAKGHPSIALIDRFYSRNRTGR